MGCAELAAADDSRDLRRFVRNTGPPPDRCLLMEMIRDVPAPRDRCSSATSSFLNIRGLLPCPRRPLLGKAGTISWPPDRNLSRSFFCSRCTYVGRKPSAWRQGNGDRHRRPYRAGCRPLALACWALKLGWSFPRCRISLSRRKSMLVTELKHGRMSSACRLFLCLIAEDRAPPGSLGRPRAKIRGSFARWVRPRKGAGRW